MNDGECKIKNIKDMTEYEDALCDNNTDDYPEVCKVKYENDDNDKKKRHITHKVITKYQIVNNSSIAWE